MKDIILTSTFIDETNEVKVNSKSFSDSEQAFYELYNQIKEDLSRLSDYSNGMDMVEQFAFLSKLMLGNVEELNGYEIDYDQETCTYTRKNPEGVESLVLCLHIY
jgi:hypothetical protein